jgi:hypothetical protein
VLDVVGFNERRDFVNIQRGKLPPLTECDQLEVVSAVWQRWLEQQADRTLDQPAYARAGRRCTLPQAFEKSVV